MTEESIQEEYNERRKEMEEQEKKDVNEQAEDVNEQAAGKVMEIRNSISGHISKIEGISELLTSLMKKEEFNQDDLSKAFDMADEIQAESEEITGLLFVLRDRLNL
jgi:hypothetical protein